MADTTERTFWRDLIPVEELFRSSAAADVYIPDAATGDERYYGPFSETVSRRPLSIATTQNRWADILFAKGAGLSES
jgi:2,4'-dihydroxyacetophenone dioxygenase